MDERSEFRARVGGTEPGFCTFIHDPFSRGTRVGPAVYRALFGTRAYGVEGRSGGVDGVGSLACVSGDGEERASVGGGITSETADERPCFVPFVRSTSTGVALGDRYDSGGVDGYARVGGTIVGSVQQERVVGFRMGSRTEIGALVDYLPGLWVVNWTLSSRGMFCSVDRKARTAEYAALSHWLEELGVVLTRPAWPDLALASCVAATLPSRYVDCVQRYRVLAFVGERVMRVWVAMSGFAPGVSVADLGGLECCKLSRKALSERAGFSGLLGCVLPGVEEFEIGPAVAADCLRVVVGVVAKWGTTSDVFRLLVHVGIVGNDILGDGVYA